MRSRRGIVESDVLTEELVETFQTSAENLENFIEYKANFIASS
jgi:succinate dehydrogenase flavin-adding protein (antitoxin of CptAB toxin-antitoxin module)